MSSICISLHAALLVFFALSVGLAAGQDDLMILTPTQVAQCSTVHVLWSGGTGPYDVRVYDQDNDVNDTLPGKWSQITTTSVVWDVKVPAGTGVFFFVRDGTGTTAASNLVLIQSGSTSCMRSPHSSFPSQNSDPSSSSPPAASSLPPLVPSSPPPSPPTPSGPVPSSPSQPSRPPSSLYALGSDTKPLHTSAFPSPSLSNSMRSSSGQDQPTKLQLEVPGSSGEGGSSERTGLSSGEVVAIAATTTIVPVIGILLFGVFCWKRRRRLSKAPNGGEDSLPGQPSKTGVPLHRVLTRGQSYTDLQRISTAFARAPPPTAMPARETASGQYVSGPRPLMSYSQERPNGPGILDRDSADPAPVRLDPSQQSEIAQQYQTKLQKEVERTNQQVSPGPSSGLGIPRAEGSGTTSNTRK